GKKMITSGMVSPNSRDRGRDFLVDALFNRGFSGGIVMAIRDGIPNFELVGIVSAVAADEEAVLIPDPSYVSDRPAHGQPYIGRPIISPRKVVKYGVTYGIGIEAIREFIAANREAIEGYGLKSSLLLQ
ncbi:MAG: hypothetical protein KDI06_09365, partial [Calditrichaeota bacterium]|nr:hypothetical protein [Calditrichota bacterium]